MSGTGLLDNRRCTRVLSKGKQISNAKSWRLHMLTRHTVATINRLESIGCAKTYFIILSQESYKIGRCN